MGISIQDGENLPVVFLPLSTWVAKGEPVLILSYLKAGNNCQKSNGKCGGDRHKSRDKQSALKSPIHTFRDKCGITKHISVSYYAALQGITTCKILVKVKN